MATTSQAGAPPHYPMRAEERPLSMFVDDGEDESSRHVPAYGVDREPLRVQFGDRVVNSHQVAVPHRGEAPVFPREGELWFVASRIDDAEQIVRLGYRALVLFQLDRYSGVSYISRVLARICDGASIVLIPGYGRCHSETDTAVERARDRFQTIAKELAHQGVQVELKECSPDSAGRFHKMAKQVQRDLQPAERMPLPEDIEDRLSVDEPPVDWLIPGVLVHGKAGFVGGGEKCLKTSISADLAASLASGTRFLGHFPASKPTNVLFVSGESGGRNINDLFRRIKDSHGIESLSRRLSVIDRVLKVDSESGVEHIRNVLGSTGARVLIIDPLYLCVSGDGAENMMIQGQRLQPLVDVCNDLGVTLLLVHHTKQKGFKSDKYAPAVFTDLAWAGWAAFARQWLMVGRREAYDYNGQHRLWLNLGGNDGHSLVVPVDINENVYPEPRVWQPEVLSVEQLEARKQERKNQRREQAEARKNRQHDSNLRAAKDRIVSRLRELGEPSTKSTLKCVRTDVQIAALDELVDSGEVVVSSNQINGRERELYSLPESTTTALS